MGGVEHLFHFLLLFLDFLLQLIHILLNFLQFLLEKHVDLLGLNHDSLFRLDHLEIKLLDVLVDFNHPGSVDEHHIVY